MILKKLSNLKRFFRSVFTKLIFISLATWFLILVAVVATFVISKKHSTGPFHRNFNNYFQYIIEDLSSPPDKQKAKQLLEATGIHISYTGDNSSWTTRNTFPDITSVRFRPFHDSATLQIGSKHGHHFLQQKTEHGTFIFDFAKRTEEESRHEKSHLLLLLLLSAILLGCYFALKKVLLPLKWLSTGVLEVSAGNLDHRVPVKGNDELGELGKGFNEMTTKVREMMETKENLLRDVSHELRSPLTRMRVALELIDDEEIKDDIRLDIEQMEKMIAAILETARVRHDSYQLNKTRCDINKVVSLVAARYKNMPPGVVFHPFQNPVHCSTDENAFKIVITNLIDNALKFSKASSSPVEIQLTQQDNNAIITVTDHGKGIKENEIRYIFEPFYRTDKSRPHGSGGFGLGLSLCKAILEAHGGSIEITSTIGDGTQVIVSLPLQE